jgi:ubiquinone/menaquinone biosynthesis C-methylase UbiE
MTEFIAQDFQEVYAIDIAEEMIEKARRRISSRENIHLSATDGLHLPFADTCFDAVFSYIVFRHMPDHKTVKSNIEETARVLKKGGLAKIQLRGRPTERGKWFSGSSFTMPQVESMIEGIPLQILKTEGAETRSFWVWFQKL